MIGRTISHYKILDKLGEGGMGIVYKAKDLRLERVVALKFLAKHLVEEAEGRRRFIREAKAAASLDHSNICTVYEIDEAEGQIFIAMAFIDGPSLKEKIADGPLPLKEALDLGAQAAEGLQEAHRKGIVHRDIKPANVMVTPKGSARLHATIMDFGLAQLSDRSKLTKGDTTLGTIAYMSPEQTQGAAVDHRSDIWSLGVVLYEMVTGQMPFKGHYEQAIMYSILNEEPEPITALRSGVPMELEWIVGKMMAKSAVQRYQSAAELVVDLQTLAQKIESGKTTLLRGRTQAATTPLGQPFTGFPQASEKRSGEPGTHGRFPETAEAGGRPKRRQIRDRLLDLANQGLLPDRILSRALEVVAQEPDRLPAHLRRYEGLLDDLYAKRIQVGEFIDGWHRLESEPDRGPEPPPPAPSVAPFEGRGEYRSKMELFGLPLFHLAHGRDPLTGRQRIAKGILAMGDIAIGLIAFGGVAIGGATAGGVSLGLFSAGGVSVGLLVAVGAVVAGSITAGAVRFDIGGAVGPILVVVAAVLLIRAIRGRRREQKQAPEEGEISGWVVFGGREMRSTNADFRGANVFAMFGGYKLDLTGARIASGEAEIEANAMFGGVEILVPPDWSVTIRGIPLFGGYANKTTSPTRQGGAQRLIVNGLALFGGVEVKN